ncbi:hypothetical protein CesoFtcFv8_013331 [Champsocephalus esox]|uniref:Uncharacterized protein n=1 Tax=Champsocephalus esox TaxID=159716 RepID=A0AAN8BXB5_9TELE|nr:hypothetical protein CesoFtcFv8_013331 [Champsocephalus esox]
MQDGAPDLEDAKLLKRRQRLTTEASQLMEMVRTARQSLGKVYKSHQRKMILTLRQRPAIRSDTGTVPES